jgi:hypothetical protein
MSEPLRSTIAAPHVAPTQAISCRSPRPGQLPTRERPRPRIVQTSPAAPAVRCRRADAGPPAQQFHARTTKFDVKASQSGPDEDRRKLARALLGISRSAGAVPVEARARTPRLRLSRRVCALRARKARRRCPRSAWRSTRARAVRRVSSGVRRRVRAAYGSLRYTHADLARSSPRRAHSRNGLGGASVELRDRSI